jgi:hypothetical protein
VLAIPLPAPALSPVLTLLCQNAFTCTKLRHRQETQSRRPHGKYQDKHSVLDETAQIQTSLQRHMLNKRTTHLVLNTHCIRIPNRVGKIPRH